MLVLLALSIIVVPKFYITGDGASHTYNAKVLFDFVLNHERDFYKEFYVINKSIDPNWMSHLMIGLFLQIFPYWLSDKLFQIIYIVVFAYGFRYLFKAITPQNSFLSFLFFPFVFTLAFQEGFYNFSLAMGFFCWTLAYYIRFRHALESPVKQVNLSLLLLCTTFSHGMPAIYVMFIILLIWLIEHVRLFMPFDIKKLQFEFSRYLLMYLPSAFLILLFMAKRGSVTVPHVWSRSKKCLEFLKGWGFQSTRHAELYPAIAVGVLVFAFLVLQFFAKKKLSAKHANNLNWVFLFMSAFTFVSYINCPHSIGGAGSIDIRLVILPYLFLLLFFATRPWNEVHKRIFIISSFVISLSFLVIRFPYVLKANAVGKEIMNADEFISDKSVVLNLHFDYWQQLPNGDSIFQQDGSFLHFSDFLGAEKNKHLILLNNYEAEINYFPVNWQAGKNPRETVAGFIQGELPPCGDYSLYEKQVHRNIDFILFQNWRNTSLQNPCVKNLVDSINMHFIKVYESPHQAVVVFKRKN